MKLEDQVCSLDLSKRLSRLGVKQESYFEYLFRPDLYKWELHPVFKNQLGISAFTVAELNEIIFQKNSQYLEQMGFIEITIEKVYGSIEDFYRVTNCQTDHIIDDKNQANALAKLFIILFEERMELENE